MDNEVVVRDILTEEMTEAGEKLISRLDELKSELRAAFWFFNPHERTWKLMIISNQVKILGPRAFYKKILDANKQAINAEKVLSLNEIGVADTSHHIAVLLRKAISTGNDISGIRFSRNTINGVYIEDTYIYRLNLNQ